MKYQDYKNKQTPNKLPNNNSMQVDRFNEDLAYSMKGKNKNED